MRDDAGRRDLLGLAPGPRPDSRPLPGSGAHAAVAPEETDESRPAIIACIDALERAAQAASDLGIATDRARAVVEESRIRLGIAPDAYVLALAGGTGVGKSSLLNAIAGASVSAAGVRRPTTDRPVAWIPRSAGATLRPLLERLEVGEVHAHDAAWASDLVILDMPDLDSIDDEHRSVVDEVLPRVDAVAWVVDPEKYADAALHIGYLAPLGERFARQVLVVNKADLLDAASAERVRFDARRRLASVGLGDGRVLLVSAREPEDETRGLGELRTWLAQGAEAKRIVADRIRADARAAARDLARRAGVAEQTSGHRRTSGEVRLVRAGDRARVGESVEAEALRILDLPGLRRQAVAATRESARGSGAGPAGFITSRLYRWSGLSASGADPVGYLRRWRRRGSLAAAVSAVESLSVPVLASLPPEARAAAAAAVAPALAAKQADAAIDESIAALGDVRPPTSRLWPLLGLAQSIVAADLLIAVLWLVALWVSHVGAGTASIPIVGPVPWPFALLVGGLILGLVLARLLALHAGWLGSRWADRLAARASAGVAERVSAAVLRPLDAMESAREALRDAVSKVAECAPESEVTTAPTPSSAGKAALVRGRGLIAGVQRFARHDEDD